jgi:hypothetical protein
MSAVEREEGGRRRLDAVEMEESTREAESAAWRGAVEMEDGGEHQFSGRCGHLGCCDEKKLRNEARGKRNLFFRWTVRRSRPG